MPIHSHSTDFVIDPSYHTLCMRIEHDYLSPDAFQECDKAIQLKPLLPHAYLHGAIAAFSQKNDAQVIHYCEIAIDIMKNHEEAHLYLPMYPDIYFYFAQAKYRQGFYLVAIEKINEAIKLLCSLPNTDSTKLVAYHTFRACLHMCNNDIGYASRDCEISLEYNPHHPVALNILADTHWLKADYLVAAIHYKNALFYAPDNSLSLMGLGYTYLCQQQWENAKKYFTTLLNILAAPADTPLHTYFKSFALQGKGLCEMAQNSFQLSENLFSESDTMIATISSQKNKSDYYLYRAMVFSAWRNSNTNLFISKTLQAALDSWPQNNIVKNLIQTCDLITYPEIRMSEKKPNIRIPKSTRKLIAQIKHEEEENQKREEERAMKRARQVPNNIPDLQTKIRETTATVSTSTSSPHHNTIKEVKVTIVDDLSLEERIAIHSLRQLGSLFSTPIKTNRPPHHQDNAGTEENKMSIHRFLN